MSHLEKSFMTVIRLYVQRLLINWGNIKWSLIYVVMFFHHILIILKLDFSSFYASLAFKSQKKSFPVFKGRQTPLLKVLKVTESAIGF